MNKISVKSIVLAMTLSVGSVGLVFAQTTNTTNNNLTSEASPLQIKLVQQKVIVENNKEVFKEANKVNPSDTIEYVATYKNVSNKAIEKLKMKLPIPEGMYLKDLSVEVVEDDKISKDFLVSLDNKNYGKYPIEVKVKQGNVTLVEKAHILSYKSIMAEHPKLEPGKTVILKARMQVVPAGEIGMKMELEQKSQNDKIIK